MTPNPITSALLAWYDRHARELPWRGAADPYAVWVSEVMLQQTRVETVIPYYERWMEHFPTLAHLAAASEKDVLALWEGLGYYSRARNLHRAAQRVMTEMNGRLPQSPEALERLPGIGKYTAGAIASIAFGVDSAALDGNIRRVMARVFDVSTPARSPEGERILWELAESLLPAGRAGDYNQALMDLGAVICTPRAPDCSSCPLQSFCLSWQKGVQEQRPVMLRKPPTPHFTVTAAIIHRPGEVLIAQRPADGLLGSLWEFPGGKLQPGEDLAACLQREIDEELAVKICIGEPLGVYRHVYTHFRVTLHAFHCRLANGAQPQPIQVQDLRWVHLEQLTGYPMGKIDRQIAEELIYRPYDHQIQEQPC